MEAAPVQTAPAPSPEIEKVQASAIIQEKLVQIALKVRFGSDEQENFDKLVKFYTNLRDNNQRDEGLYAFLLEQLPKVSKGLLDIKTLPTESGEIHLDTEEQQKARRNKWKKNILLVKDYYITKIGSTLVQSGSVTENTLQTTKPVDDESFNQAITAFPEPIDIIRDFIPYNNPALSHLSGLFEHDFDRLFDFLSIQPANFFEECTKDEPALRMLTSFFEELQTLDEVLNFLDHSGQAELGGIYSVDTLFKTFVTYRRERVISPTGQSLRSVDAWILTRTAMLNAFEFVFEDKSNYTGSVKVEITNNTDRTDTIRVYDEVPSEWQDNIKKKVEFYHKLGSNHPNLPVGNTKGLNQIAFRLGQLKRPIPTLSAIYTNSQGKQEKYIEFTV